jgi:hypothetical protein
MDDPGRFIRAHGGATWSQPMDRASTPVHPRPQGRDVDERVQLFDRSGPPAPAGARQGPPPFFGCFKRFIRARPGAILLFVVATDQGTGSPAPPWARQLCPAAREAVPRVIRARVGATS